MGAAALLVSAMAAPAAAVELEALQRCKGLAEPSERLACYDRVSGYAAVPPSSGQVTATPASGAAVGAQDPATFGLEYRDATRRLDEIRSTITGPFEGWGPRALITLANGQVWQIVDGSQAVYSLQSPGVRIVRGMSGSFFMQVDGVGPTPRVRRVR